MIFLYPETTFFHLDVGRDKFETMFVVSLIISIVIRILFDAVKTIPVHIFPDIGQRVETLIESQVNQLKAAIPVNPTQPPAAVVCQSKPGETI